MANYLITDIDSSFQNDLLDGDIVSVNGYNVNNFDGSSDPDRSDYFFFKIPDTFVSDGGTVNVNLTVESTNNPNSIYSIGAFIYKDDGDLVGELSDDEQDSTLVRVIPGQSTQLQWNYDRFGTDYSAYYYVEVYLFSSAPTDTQVVYDLDISLTEGSENGYGDLTNQSINVVDTFDSAAYNFHTAEFTISQPGELTLRFNRSSNNVKANLFYDSNNNQVFDRDDSFITSLTDTVQGPVETSVNLNSTGTYFGQLELLSGSSGDYDFTFSHQSSVNPPLPPIDPLTGMDDNIYRFYNGTSKGHFFTTSEIERDTVLANPQWGYIYEGTPFRVSTTPETGLNAVYRFYNNSSKGHFFTMNEAERDTVLANPSWGYTYEGTGFYALDKDASIGEDVYRFYNSSSKGHFFTTSEAERDTVLANPSWGYTYEGVAFEANTI